DGQGGPWILPVARGSTRSSQLGGAIANVIFDPKDFGSLVSSRFSGAIATWEGVFPGGLYDIVLEGNGGADLWIAGQASFAAGIREYTLGSPAMHPDIIAVGATVNRTSFRAAAGETLTLVSGQIDEPAGLSVSPVGASIAGPVGTFSGAGPGLGG